MDSMGTCFDVFVCIRAQGEFPEVTAVDVIENYRTSIRPFSHGQTLGSWARVVFEPTQGQSYSAVC